ncbi:MAG: SDR family oxidoreductase [Ramlibacter sp.]|nr:SDR family oxidoreductase [Ramlibacter sp.]
MRVLVTGASGFIGRAVAQALLRQGHQVICVSRRPEPATGGEPLAADLAQVPSQAWWLPRLAGVDAVVNAVGILREQGGQTFRAIHTEAPIELFEACAVAEVSMVVQISALGADESAQSRYHLSKKAADDALRRLPLRGAIVQPSLVYGESGASAQLFNLLAALPVLALPRRGAMLLQPVHLDDVVAGVLALLERRPAGTDTIPFVGPRPLAMRDYLSQLRHTLRLGRRALVVPLPEFLFRWGAAIASRLPGSFLDSETAGMLLRGSAAPSQAFERLLGREPRPVGGFIAPDRAASLRTDAVLGVWVPALRLAIAFLWIWTGIVSLGLYPVQDSLALLGRVGLHGVLASFALYGAAGLDMLLGVLTLAAPARLRPAVWAAQLLLIGGYTVLITLFLPEYWLHPYGPISKNLPLMAGICLARALEPRWTT